jgi:tetratricopeptide (TPR) repeat protein
MHQYGVREVEKLLGLPRSTIRALIGAGFVTPARGPRNAWLFSFQDLIVLRTAQTLAAAKLPHRRITKSLKELRRHLPDEMPLSGLRIAAIADRVVVREGDAHWQAESGQYLLAFEGDPLAGSLSVLERAPARAEILRKPERLRDTERQRESADALNRGDIDAAIKAYERAIATDPTELDAHINLGQLLHESGRLSEAERVYRDALKTCGNNALLLYNFGVLLDDMDRKVEAMAAYQLALSGDPGLADCHYNLALLYEELERPKDAIRHMAQYRRLLAGKPSR